MGDSFFIGNRPVGRGNPCLVVAEVGQAHEGSLGMAYAFIDAIAAAGADAVKFQTHIASAESTPAEPWRLKFSLQDKTRYDYWKRMEFTEEEWKGLKRHAEERDLLFISSPFSVEAVELLERVGVEAWKLASGEVTNTPAFERLLSGGLPILLSTGMSPFREIDEAVERIKARGSAFVVLQCTSMYPTPADKVGLNVIPLLRSRYGCHVGLSDHSGKTYPSLAAVMMGASVVEVHVTLSREMFGPDVPVSLTTGELKQLVEGIRFLEESLRNPVDKDVMASTLSGMRDLFTKSVVARTDLDEGTILREEHLAAKKPGTGIPASRMGELIGARLKCALKVDDLLKDTDLEFL